MASEKAAVCRTVREDADISITVKRRKGGRLLRWRVEYDPELIESVEIVHNHPGDGASVLTRPDRD